MQLTPSYKVLVPFVSIYILCLLAPTIDILATYTINLFFFSIPFGVSALLFPAIYPFSDSMTEVYGRRISFYIVITCYIVVISFSFVNNFLLSSSDNYYLYKFLLKSSLLLTCVGPVGYIFTSYLNVKYIYQLKLKMRGKHFVIRSLVCSGLSEAIISLVVTPIIFYQHGLNYLIKIYFGTVFVKILVTVPFVWVAKFLVIIYRYIDNIDDQAYNTTLIMRGKNLHVRNI